MSTRHRPQVSQTVGAIRSDMLRLRRNVSFSTCLCVFCVRWSARKIHTNMSYNSGSPQATHLYGSIAFSRVGLLMNGLPTVAH